MTETTAILRQAREAIAMLEDRATERSYYPLLCELLTGFAQGAGGLGNPHATIEESSLQHEQQVGFPDITLRDGAKVIGWVEVKLPEDSLGAPKFREQFAKYREALENIIFSNLREWQLWQWVGGEPRQVWQAQFDLVESAGDREAFERLFERFFEGRVSQSATPQELALVLAKKARLLSGQVEEALTLAAEGSDLRRLQQTFAKTLIQNIAPHQFANMVAETIAYSLFLAALERWRGGESDEALTLNHAIDWLPKQAPILTDLYDLIRRTAGGVTDIRQGMELLIEQLNASEIGTIYHRLIQHTPSEDPVIQFYEPFLAEYDPKEREARGVYYTPKPVVDWIVRAVDWLLRERFGRRQGLADESVHLLDPAAGTGTFLLSAMQEVWNDTWKAQQALGEEMVQKTFSRIVRRHILKRFYGFELLIAPYAIAHLKLRVEIERLGFEFAQNERFQVYLANTLDDPDRPPHELFGFDSIPQESKRARQIKNEEPILAIVGNPPYSNFGRMNRSDWILGLLKDYKEGLAERKINLDDDFIKFIRFAQWKLEQSGQGVCAMITNNSFIDGITHRRMRRSLMEAFDEIWIYNLHGNSRKGEVAPDGGIDENLFDIRQGVSISIFVRLPAPGGGKRRSGACVVRYRDLWGVRERKFAALREVRFEETEWQEIDVAGFDEGFRQTEWGRRFGEDLNFFVPKSTNGGVVMREYGEYWGVRDIFPHYSSGIQTKRDDLTIQFEASKLCQIEADFLNLSPEQLKSNYRLPADGRDWTLRGAQADIATNDPMITDVLYRPFDLRKTLYTGKSRGFIAYPRTKVMGNMLRGANLGLITSRQQPIPGFRHIFICKIPIDIHSVSDQNYLFPLYLYPPDKGASLTGEQDGRQANVAPDFVEACSAKLGLGWLPDGRGDLVTTFGPEDLLYYAYALFHSPGYRERYAEQLAIDFPRLPLPNRALLRALAPLGNQVANLHLLGDNPFDDSSTIFDNAKRWGLRIDGERPHHSKDWQVEQVRYMEQQRRVYVNGGQYFEGIAPEVWRFRIGAYRVCEKWLKDRKKAERSLSSEDLLHWMKMAVAIRETIGVMAEIEERIGGWR